MAKKDKPLYPHAMLVGFFDAWCQQHPDNKMARRAWAKMKGVAQVIAIVDYGMTDTSQDVAPAAMAWAWEDIAMGFRARGDHLITGTVLQFCLGLTDYQQLQFARDLEAVFSAIEDYCRENGVMERYDAADRVCRVYTKPHQFTLSVVFPANGKATRDFLSQGGDAPKVKSSALLGDEEVDETPKASPKLTGSKPQTRLQELAASVSGQAFRRQSGGFLTLLDGGKSS